MQFRWHFLTLFVLGSPLWRFPTSSLRSVAREGHALFRTILLCSAPMRRRDLLTLYPREKYGAHLCQGRLLAQSSSENTAHVPAAVTTLFAGETVKLAKRKPRIPNAF